MKRLFFLCMLFCFMPMIEGAQYTIDRSHSAIQFSVLHMGITTVSGQFNDFSLVLEWDETNMNASYFKAVIPVDTIDTNNKKRDQHLISKDFFDEAVYDSITFTTTSFRKNNNQWIAIGRLRIKDIVKTIEIPFSVLGPIIDPWGNTRIGLNATFDINRFDYDLVWDKRLADGTFLVSDSVKIRLNIEAKATTSAISPQK